jgi:hypothetical protein
MWLTSPHISTIAKQDFKNENKSQLEKATFLSLTTGILHHDFSWLSDAPGTSAEDKAKTGASRPTQEQDELQAL